MALILLLIFIVVIFLLRIIIQYRLTGDFGIRLFNHSSSKLTMVSDSLLLVSFNLIVILIVLDSINLITHQIYIAHSIKLASFLVGLMGLGVAIISQHQMGKSWRLGVDNNEKTKLITHGIYQHIRNPIYTGILLSCFILPILIPHIYSVFVVIFLYLSLELQVRFIEEPYLSHTHKTEFELYKQTAGRYLPKFR